MTRITWIALRELLENVRTRGFWLSLLMVPVLLLVTLSIPLFAESARPALQFAVTDHSGWLLAEVMQRAERQDLTRLLRSAAEPGPARAALQQEGLDALAARYRQADGAARTALLDRLLGADPEGGTDPQVLQFRSWWRTLDAEALRSLQPEAVRARLRLVHPAERWLPPGRAAAWLAEDRIFAHIIIPEDPVGSVQRPGEPLQYRSRNLTNTELRDWFGRAASEAVRDQRLAESGTSSTLLSWLDADLRFETAALGGDGQLRDSSTQDVLRQWAPVAFVYVLWISVFAVTQMLLTSTIEEKSNKLVEVLLAAVTPVDLMAGKIIGIAVTGLIIVGTWVTAFIGVTLALPALLGAAPGLDLSALAADPAYLGSFLLYFVLGYLLYAALLCGLGSVCNTLKEAQTMMIPVQILLLVPLILMVPIARDPAGPLANVLTWIPPFTPFVMMNRAAQPPDAVVYLGTTLMMLLAIAAALWAAAKVFRVGILMTGQPPGLREVLRWIASPVVASPVVASPVVASPVVASPVVAEPAADQQDAAAAAQPPLSDAETGGSGPR